MSIKFSTYYLIISLITLTTVHGQKKAEQLDEFFSYCYENNMFNGIVVVLDEKNEIFKKGYGYKDENEEQRINENTPFYLASLTKQFTAFGIAILEQNEKLNYEDKVQKHLPYFPYPHIKISHLLHHTSGLPNYERLLNSQKERLKIRYDQKGKTVTNIEVAQIFKKMKPELKFVAGTEFEYSNTGYMYLALLIEEVSDTTFINFLKQTIFKPLDMQYSGLLGTDSGITPVSAFKRTFLGHKKDNSIPKFFAVYGDAGIYSSISDLIKWDAALRNNALLNIENSKKLYETPKLNDTLAPYGMGWFVRTLPFNNNQAVTHSGIFAGYTNSIFRELVNHNTIIVLSNNSHTINSEINQAVVRILYGIPHKLPKLKGSRVLAKLILNEGINKSKVFYEAHKNDERYDFSEEDLNRLGYDFLELGKITEAISVFEWNVEENPKSSNVYDSLGEAYLKAGNKEKAIAYYTIALEKNPENKNAKTIIQKLIKDKN